MVSLLRKLVPNTDLRKLFGGLVVIAANAGGAWTPIGGGRVHEGLRVLCERICVSDECRC